MTFAEFESRAWQEWERIPPGYLAGVDGLVIERESRPHPEFDDVYTLGECVTESYPSDYGGPDTTRSLVVLYYGSFWRLSRLDPEFDWEEELWETLTHELQHHLESLAAEDDLGDMDHAADENFKRYEGESFDPFFFRHGLALEDGWYRVDDEYFLEALATTGPLEFRWQGAGYRLVLPATAGDVVIVSVMGVPGPRLHVVLVRGRGWRGALRALWSRSVPVVTEVDAEAEPLD